MSNRTLFTKLNDDRTILNLATVWDIGKFDVPNSPRIYGVYFEYGIDVVFREEFETETERDARFEEIQNIVMSKNLQPKNDYPIGITTTAEI